MRARTCLWHMASTVPASGRAAGSGDISFCTHAQGNRQQQSGLSGHIPSSATNNNHA